MLREEATGSTGHSATLLRDDLPVLLTGFMGVGKSKIGRLLAQRLGREFFDTDQWVEAAAGKTIAALFADRGETHFRQLEHQCLRAALARRKAVIALGGGAIVQARNRELIRRSGLLICLQADVDTILARVSRNAERPLLAGLGPAAQRARIERLLAERAPFYACSDLTVCSSDERTPEETTELLIEMLRNYQAF